jgi:mxaA protein
VQEQRGADGREACRALHAAFNETAGRTVFAGAVDSFVAQVPRFAGLRDDIHIFFERSQAAFYADSAQAQDPAPDWLLAFARACRDAERGSGATPSTASP